jgi:hypothetical protein
MSNSHADVVGATLQSCVWGCTVCFCLVLQSQRGRRTIMTRKAACNMLTGDDAGAELPVVPSTLAQRSWWVGLTLRFLT